MITLNVRKSWLQHPGDLAKRLAAIVVGVQQSVYDVYQKENGSWQLDCGNDWFMSIEGDQVSLRYRYDSAYPKEFWEALKLVIEGLLR